MTPSEVHEASTLLEDLRTWRERIKLAEGTGLGVTIQGRYYDDLRDEVRPHVIAYLRRREAITIERLRQLGVGL